MQHKNKEPKNIGRLNGNRELASKVLREKGRPFSLEDPSFRAKCTICDSLINYCCC